MLVSCIEGDDQKLVFVEIYWQSTWLEEHVNITKHIFNLEKDNELFINFLQSRIYIIG